MINDVLVYIKVYIIKAERRMKHNADVRMRRHTQMCCRENCVRFYSISSGKPAYICNAGLHYDGKTTYATLGIFCVRSIVQFHIAIFSRYTIYIVHSCCTFFTITVPLSPPAQTQTPAGIRVCGSCDSTM